MPVGSFPGVGFIDGNCTVTRVGPKHLLTAAHCVYDATRDVQTLLPDRDITVDFSRPWSKRREDTRIARTWVAPEWARVCMKEKKCTGSVGSVTDAALPDVALVELTKELPSSIATYPIARDRAEPGKELWVLGAGCEVGAMTAGERKHRLKGAPLRVLEGPLQEKVGTTYSAYSATDWAKYHEVVFPTAGLHHPMTAGASLCPGDSGGPAITHVRQGKSERYKVYGVNASYSFAGADQISAVNFHTRLQPLVDELRARGAIVL